MNTFRFNPATYTLTACIGLKPGDAMELEPGLYVNQHIGLKAAAAGATVRGILGPNGEKPHFQAVSLGLNAKGKPLLPPDFPAPWSGAWTGRGTCVVKANDVTIENIEFSGAKSNSFNGAGIRHEAMNLMVKGCVFHGNENGILGSEHDDPLTPIHDGGMVWVEGSHFYRNGDGSGQSHNIYISRAETFVFVNNVSDSALMGHLLKGRAKTTVVYGNIFRDGDGNPSYHLDIDGGLAIISGNVHEKGPGTGNPKCIVHYYLWHDNGENKLIVRDNRMSAMLDVVGNFVFADERIETKVAGKTVYDGVGVIAGRISKNVCIYSPRLNGKGTGPYPSTYGKQPFRVPAAVEVVENIVVPLGKEPPQVMPVTVLTPKLLPYYIKSMTA